MHETMISREALVAEITAELRFAELKDSRIMAATYRRVLDIIAKQKEFGEVNPTAFVFYGGDREWT